MILDVTHVSSQLRSSAASPKKYHTLKPWPAAAAGSSGVWMVAAQAAALPACCVMPPAAEPKPAAE